MWLKRMFKNKKPDHVVLRTAPKRQKLSIKFVQNGISEGWLTLKDGSIQIKGFQEIKDPDTGIRNKIQAPTYQIIKFPGVFCLARTSLSLSGCLARHLLAFSAPYFSFSLFHLALAFSGFFFVQPF